MFIYTASYVKNGAWSTRTFFSEGNETNTMLLGQVGLFIPDDANYAEVRDNHNEIIYQHVFIEEFAEVRYTDENK